MRFRTLASPRVCPKRLSSLTASLSASDAIPGCSQLENGHAFVELTDGTQNLSNQHLGRIVVGGREIGSTVTRNYPYVQFAQFVENQLPDNKISGQSIGSFDQHQSDAAASESLYELG